MIDASGTRTPERPSAAEHAPWCEVPEHVLARRSNPVSGAESIGCIGQVIEFGKIAGWLTAPPAGHPVSLILDWLGDEDGKLTVADAAELRGLLGALLLQAGVR